jgi:hypothetical protein
MGQLTLADARRSGMSVTAQCSGWTRDNDHLPSQRCRERIRLDVNSLAWTRGMNFPLERLKERLQCPRCGSRKVIVLYTANPTPGAVKQA